MKTMIAAMLAFCACGAPEVPAVCPSTPEVGAPCCAAESGSSVCIGDQAWLCEPTGAECSPDPGSTSCPTSADGGLLYPELAARRNLWTHNGSCH